MERENRDDTAGGGGESETQPVISSVRDDKEDELEGSAAKTKSDSVNEPGEAEHPEQNDTTTGGESEIKSLSSTTKERGEADEVKEVNTVSSTNVSELSAEESETMKDTSPTSQTVSTNIKELLPELTLVLIGDTNSIEVGSKNILLDHDEQTQQFSSSLYDLCGRHISVINMLGQQHTDKFPLNQGVHAFLLLLPNGLQNSHYSSGVQWLEKTFGKESLAYLMTVVTHGSDEECDRALTDLKANSSFVEKRFHTCTKSMRDEKEIIALLGKVDDMVSKNDPHCYNGLTCGENKEHEEEQTSDSSVFHQNQTADEMENRGVTTEIKCEPVNEPGDAENSEKNDESRKAGGEPEVMSTIPLASSEKGLDTSAGETDEDKQINNENSSNPSERPTEDSDTLKDTSSTSQTVSTVTKELDQQEERAATTEDKCDPVNDCGDAEHSQEKDDGTTVGGESEIKSQLPSAANEQGLEPSAGETDEVKQINNESSSNPSERPTEDCDTLKDTSSTSQTVSTVTKELDQQEERAATTEEKCDPVNDCGDAEHSQEKDDGTTVGGESEIKSQLPSAANEQGLEPSAGETDEVKQINNESSSNTSERPTEDCDTLKDTSSTSQTVSTVTKELDQQETRAATTEEKCDPVNDCGDAEHSQEKDDGTTVGGESEIKSQLPSAANEQGLEPSAGETDEVKQINNESSSNTSERPTEDSDTLKDTSSTSQTVSTVTKELDQQETRAATTEEKCDPVNDCGDAEHSQEKDDGTTVGGESEIKSQLPSAANEQVKEKKQNTDENGVKIKLNHWFCQCDRVNDGKHSERNDKPATGGESEIKSVPSETGTSDVDMSANKDEQSVKISEVKNKTETLFHRLQLQDKQKLSPTDFLKIGPPVKQDHETSEKDLAHTFLQKLMILDYRARYIPVRQDHAEVSQSTSVPVAETVDTVDNDEDLLFSTNPDSNQSKQTHIHPMDIQMAVFHCSDSFLKQNMMTKLSQCQYALPLLVPDPVKMYVECPLWTFRQIRKTWKITQTKDNSSIITMKSLPICEAETSMVSFFRLGSLSVSKSHLINTLINNRHNTFFHRNCPGSTKSRHLMNGVAEIAWYCPAGKSDDAFTDCTAFCNLHGDALTFEKQRNILTEKSSVNVVLLPTLEKTHKSMTVISALLKSSKPLIILIVDDSCDAVEIKKGTFKMGLKDRSQSDISEELKRIIGEILSGPHTSFQLETMAKVSGIRVDEDDTVCQKGKSAAEKVMNALQKMDVSKIKDKFLPCQGRLWHEWCRINKELHHLKGNIEKEKSEKQQELMKIRQKQCDASCSELMKLFIESLSSLPSTDKEYFLKWTQILIDALSTDDLNSILQSYHDKWSEVLALKKKYDKSDQLNRKQTELEQISTKLQSATFGLEHIFREMGQIYEAHKSLQKQTQRRQTDWSKYPELAAELMISGHPMELMDGDAGHVPLTWISSLLEEVIKRLGDQRVFVLSVLGVQSSGKSTMLNAMFGLQFAVSAGRCTKGAFMQLVKVSEERKKDFRFDYVLVVDTEGLRALELAGNTTPHHDNELATFVVGLGNMTLINIFGENPADMQDILQIVVQAFMRMKKVKLSPSCVFVHQNVTDIAAAEKNMDGKRCLQEKLDQMAQLAAKEEVCDAECFSDVIAFDVQKDVKYFAQLWEGSPPMAPPNPGYSDSVQELKNIILSKASQSAGITLSQFKSKVQDLWKALMNEHFVFSFKNTLEIKVYRNLEVQYGNWTWALRSNMLTIENQLYNRIENGKLDKVELSYLTKEMSKTYEEIKKEMRKYFDDDRDKEMLVQWRGQFENKIKEFHDEQVRGVKRKLDEVIQQKTACKKLDDQKTEFENKLLQKSKELAQQLKDKTQAEEELRKQFDSVWRGWVRELTADIKPIEDINLEEDHVIILYELGFEWALIGESKSSGRFKNISEICDYFDYVTLTKYQEHCEENQQPEDEKKAKKYTKGQGGYSWRTLWVYIKTLIGFAPTQQKESHTSKRSLPFEEQNHFRSLIDELEKHSLDTIRSKPVATSGYSPTYLLQVAKNVKEKVTAFESKRKYALKKEFTVDLLLYVFDRAKSWLSESHKKFKMNNDALIYLENKKH
ncbi:interferon-induced very large GTPase 1-like isoform X2 [Trachinotus anak]|uniref:interferon-induced very large GTPase 1-like isoform X2 n=1 Tax=Trachinotus anak TaxID=443729 RepID=UPI0039F1D0E1